MHSLASLRIPSILDGVAEETIMRTPAFFSFRQALHGPLNPAALSFPGSTRAPWPAVASQRRRPACRARRPRRALLLPAQQWHGRFARNQLGRPQRPRPESRHHPAQEQFGHSVTPLMRTDVNSLHAEVFLITSGKVIQ
jgi:hypothetical protein